MKKFKEKVKTHKININASQFPPSFYCQDDKYEFCDKWVDMIDQMAYNEAHERRMKRYR